METLLDTRFVECRWWNDGWTVKTVVTRRSSASMIPAPGPAGFLSPPVPLQTGMVVICSDIRPIVMITGMIMDFIMMAVWLSTNWILAAMFSAAPLMFLSRIVNISGKALKSAKPKLVSRKSVFLSICLPLCISIFFSFSFCSRWHRSARKDPYALRPVSQQYPQGCLRKSADVCLVEFRSFPT